jgi:hypothetical protein
MYVGARVLFFLALELPPSIRFGNEDQPVIRADSRQAELVYSQMENVSPDCYSQVGVGHIITKAPTITVKCTAPNYNRKASLMLDHGIEFGGGCLDHTHSQDLEKEYECVAA